MEERDKKTELLVGLFLTVGLLLLGLLVLQFSSVRELFKDTYSLTVPFPDGSGIKVGTPVMLGGSRVGKVSSKPVLNEKFDGVIIQLEIYETVKITTDSKFGIGTSGLLGDSYIEIRPSGAHTETYIEPNAVVSEANIAGSSGLGGLQDTAKDIGKKVDVAIDDIRGAVADLRLSLKRINEGALSEQSSTDLKSTISHLNAMVVRMDEKTLNEETSQNLKDAVASFKNAAVALESSMKKLDPTIAKLDSAVGNADTLIQGANKAMGSIDTSAKAIADVAVDLRKGKGVLPALLHDEAMKNEVKSLISNLRQRGILFYKDRSPAGEGTAEAPARRTVPRTTGPNKR